ncbi:hypothetical protein HDU87_002344 [Geranomyces variabilis]|uniref:Uncharacterized protein n=1 Tax=Geranomyces variabilis TaxID=109894 RepID=A0AAD5TBA1_9FUNG|nr:hypothetical protein HDU87_002344 [Geranomyces variabilis]
MNCSHAPIFTAAADTMAKYEKLRTTIFKKSSAPKLAEYKRDPLLNELLREIMGEGTPVYQISKVKLEVAEAALDLKFSAAISTPRPWNPLKEYDIVPVQLSEICESLTRSYVDAVVLEAMVHQPDAGDDTIPTSFYGEVAINAQRNDVLLSGIGDYVFAYGERPTKKIENISLVGEAKAAVDKKAIVQTLTYMGIVHRARMREGKASAQVFGYLTDYKSWMFLRISHNSMVSVSNVLPFASSDVAVQGNIVALLSRLMHEARLQSPTTTPQPSRSDLVPDPIEATMEVLHEVEMDPSSDEESDG